MYSKQKVIVLRLFMTCFKRKLVVFKAKSF